MHSNLTVRLYCHQIWLDSGGRIFQEGLVLQRWQFRLERWLQLSLPPEKSRGSQFLHSWANNFYILSYIRIYDKSVLWLLIGGRASSYPKTFAIFNHDTSCSHSRFIHVGKIILLTNNVTSKGTPILNSFDFYSEPTCWTLLMMPRDLHKSPDALPFCHWQGFCLWHVLHFLSIQTKGKFVVLWGQSGLFQNGQPCCCHCLQQ